MARLHRKWLGLLVVLAGGMVFASPAFACTLFFGDITVTPNGTGSSGSVTAQGNTKSHGYCSSPSGTADLKSGNTLGVSVGPTTSCSHSQNQLADASYAMTYVSGTGDCMFTGTNVGTLTVTSGSGSQTSSAISTTAGQYQFCVSNSTNSEGIQVPITVV